ncbi:MAG: DegT/DnrJ/EryC1/StrS family aminotransferase [Thermodesulfobacteriota bacterium]
MQFIDLAAQQKLIRNDLETRLKKVLDQGAYIQGPEVAELEKALAAFTGVEHAISCSSGTDALLMALMALSIGPGDAVLTTPFTFIATAEVISLLNAVPVFVDVEAETMNISPDGISAAIHALASGKAGDHPLPAQCGAGSKVARITDSCPVRPKAIIPVDLFGLAADYDAINAIAAKHGLAVIEDAAQSFGALYKGKRACSLTEIGCTSFFPAKPLGCYGDGGMCFTNSLDLAQKMRSVRVHGQGSHKYENVRIGINGRLDTMQAAVLLSKFLLFPDEIERRQKVAKRYNDLISKSDLFLVPKIFDHAPSVWAQYTLVARENGMREAVLKHLSEKKIPTAIYYPTPLHLQKAFDFLEYRKGDFPVSEDLAGRVFSLPMHPYLSEADQDQIVEALLAFKG